MLHRLALRVRTRFFIALAAAAPLGVAAGLVLHRAAPAPASGPAPDVELHVRVAFGARLSASWHASRELTALPPGTHDGRERWWVVRAPVAALDALRAEANVDDAFVAPAIALPRDTPGAIAARPPDASCPITTPSYADAQGYVGPAPAGIDAPAAWRDNVRGQGERFADIEGGWNAAHEDLPGERIAHVHGVPIPGLEWFAHGTAVLGEVVGRDNGLGVVGLAPDVDRVVTSSIGGSTVADAIDAAAEQLGPGDVLLVELQGGGPRGRYVPVEFWDDVYDVIAAATARGVVVVEAAGNGAENLDLRVYQGKFDRARRDSGALLVGAGAPARPGFEDRARLDFSNYGSRVDVQGWGRQVATLEYGDLQACDDQARERHYTALFAGTSSASPIVAGAALLVEGTARRAGRPLSPTELRALLVATGTPQTGDRSQHIGPRPDLARALPRVRPR